MATVHDVLRYLLERVPHSTQADHDQVAALIDADDPAPKPAPTLSKETSS